MTLSNDPSRPPQPSPESDAAVAPDAALAPVADEDLAAVTVGPRRPHNAPIRLDSYDPRWAGHFAQLAGLVRQALASRVLRLEHVGSTSVPGLAAKPVIDMVLEVQDSSDEADYVPALEAQGFALRIREAGWFEHRMLKTPGIEGNLHVFSEGCEEIERMLLFRDWLRAHDGERTLYEQTKRALAERVWRHTQDYANAKSAVVREILERAKSLRS